MKPLNSGAAGTTPPRKDANSWGGLSTGESVVRLARPQSNNFLVTFAVSFV